MIFRKEMLKSVFWGVISALQVVHGISIDEDASLYFDGISISNGTSLVVKTMCYDGSVKYCL